MFDLLVYPDGPRLRDRLSHGEIYLQTTHEIIIHLLLDIFIHLLHLTKSNNSDSMFQDAKLKDIINFHLDYESVVHPISTCKEEVSTLEAERKIIHNYFLECLILKIS